MKHYKIGITFDSLTECDAWESEHITDRLYNGEPVFMVTHTEAGGKVTLDEIITI